MDVGYYVLALALHEDACVFVFPNIQCFILLSILEKVEELLVVDLEERAIDCVAAVAFRLHRVQTLEQSLDRARNNSELLLVLQEGVLTMLRFEAATQTVHLLLVRHNRALTTTVPEVVVPVRAKHREGLT